MAYFAGSANCMPSWLPIILPCWAVRFLIGAIVTAAMLDVTVYYIYPKIKARSWVAGNRKLSMPKISIPVSDSEIKRVFRTIERKLDKGSKLLKKAGIKTQKEIDRDGCYSYKYFYSNQFLYRFVMTPNIDIGNNQIGFDDGWAEESRINTYTAFGKIHATLDARNPVISVRNLSLLEVRGVPLGVNDYSYDELAELIWAKVSKVIEQGMRQISR